MSESQVAQRHTVSGTVTTATQRQQRPSAPEGDFWLAAWFGTYDELPDNAHNLGWDWDLAYTKSEVNSASAGVRTARGPGDADSFPIYVDDIDWDWLEFPELVDFIKLKEGPHYIEAKASGKSAKQSLRREGIAASEVTVQLDKISRASNVQPVVANGRVLVRKAIRREFLQGAKQGLLNVRAEELARNVGDLDLNDAFVQGLTRHVGIKSSRRRFAFTPGMTEPNGAGRNGGNGESR
jgi:hypothetical protein